MSEAIQHLISGLAQVPPPLIYGFIVIWLALESCGLPLPNELVLLAAGSLAGRQQPQLGGTAIAISALRRVAHMPAESGFTGPRAPLFPDPQRTLPSPQRL